MRILKIHFLQHWFELPDPAIEEALYDSQVMRQFVGIDLGFEPVPEWYFGMKAHIGVDSRTKLIHAVVVTPANVHYSQVMDDLLHGDETRVWGDSAYSGQTEVIQEQAPMAKGFTQKKGSRYRKLTEADRASNRTKSRV